MLKTMRKRHVSRRREAARNSRWMTGWMFRGLAGREDAGAKEVWQIRRARGRIAGWSRREIRVACEHNLLRM